MRRRDFLSAFALSAAGLFTPRRAYSFIWAPPEPKLVVPQELLVDPTGVMPGSFRSIQEAMNAVVRDRPAVVRLQAGYYNEPDVVVPAGDNDIEVIASGAVFASTVRLERLLL